MTNHMAPTTKLQRQRSRRSIALATALAVGLIACQNQDGPGQPDLQSVASACMRATACDVQPYARIGACMFTFAELSLQYGESSVLSGVYDCVNGSDRCSEVRACFGEGTPCSSAYNAVCDGDTAVYCDLLDGKTYRYECGDYGLGCRVDPQIRYLASCVPVEQATASAEPLHLSLQCDGTFCERTGEACDENLPDECTGQDVVACIEGETIHFNCHTLGLRNCAMEDNGWGRCQPQFEAEQ